MSSRSDRRDIALQTINICEKGVYAGNDGVEYNIGEEIELAIKNSEHLSPTITFNVPKLVESKEKDEEIEGEQEQESFEGTVKGTIIQITNESTLQCARRLFDEKRYKKIAILNFASAKNPGGGFLKGSQAQEESIARCSALYVCVKDSKYYEVNRKTRNGLYTNWMIYTPNAPVFRDSMTNELIKPYHVNIITCPAVNAGVFLGRKGNKEELERKMKERMDRIIRVALLHENEAIVLGAYGCGVFRNRIDFVSQHFKFLIEERYKNRFKNVTYAILGKSFKVFGDCYKYGTKQYIPSSKTKRKKKNQKKEKNRRGRGGGNQRGGENKNNKKKNKKIRSNERKKDRKKKFEVFE